MGGSSPIAILVEDERQIRRFVRTALEAEAWIVHESETLQQGLAAAATRKPDLVILDLGLPDGDGMEFLRDLRSWSKVPVIVLSARVSEQDKIEALDAGADDYLTKPFGVGELLARVRAASRRRQESGDTQSAVFEFGDDRRAQCAPAEIVLRAGGADDLIEREATGLWHLTNSGQTNWYEFAKAALEVSS